MDLVYNLYLRVVQRARGTSPTTLYLSGGAAGARYVTTHRASADTFVAMLVYSRGRPIRSVGPVAAMGGSEGER